MNADARDQLLATTRARLTRVWWLWVLGEVWVTLLVAGAVIVRLWAR
jgi:hypothetical protein